MFKLALTQYLFEYTFAGYNLYKRIKPFNYEKIIDGGDKVDLIKFLVKDEFDVINKVSKKSISKVLNNYKYTTKNDYMRHKMGPINDNKKYGFASFDDFIAEYTKIQLTDGWVRQPQYPESHFTKDYRGKIHCDNIEFDGISMIFKTPEDFLKFKEWESTNVIIPDFSNNQIDKWSKND